MIRKAKPSEAKLVFDLIASANEDLISNGIVQAPRGFPSLEKIESAIKKGETFLYFDKKQVLGCITLNHSFSSDYSSVGWLSQDLNHIAIHWLAVSPLAQRKGVGAKLMTFAEEFAKKEGSSFVRLATYHKNIRSNNFYKKLGYITKGRVCFKGWVIEDEFNCYEKEV